MYFNINTDIIMNRRKFLKSLGIGSAVAVAAPSIATIVLAQSSKAPQKKVPYLSTKYRDLSKVRQNYISMYDYHNMYPMTPKEVYKLQELYGKIPLSEFLARQRFDNEMEMRLIEGKI